MTGEHRFDVRPSKLGGWARPVMGMAFAFAWTPCIGPVLGVVLGLASHNGTLAGGVVLLFAYSLGLALPFILVGLAFGRITAALAGPATGCGRWSWQPGFFWSGSACSCSPTTGWLSDHVSTLLNASVWAG